MGNKGSSWSRELELNDEIPTPVVRNLINKNVFKVCNRELPIIKKGRSSQVLRKSFSVFIRILPKLPSELELGLADVKNFQSKIFISSSEEDLKQVDYFVAKSFKSVFLIFNHIIKHQKYVPLLEAVIFLKMIYFSSKKTLKQIVCWRKFPKLVSRMLTSIKDDNCNIAAKTMAVIAARLPDEFKKHLATNKNIIKFRFWLKRIFGDRQKNSEVYQIFENLDLKPLLARYCPKLERLIDIRDKFQEHDDVNALKMILSFLEDDSQIAEELVHSDILARLINFLSPFKENAIKEKNLKIFFEIFLQVKYEDEKIIYLDAVYFGKLVRKLVSSIEYLYTEMDQFLPDEDDDSSDESSYYLFYQHSTNSIMVVINYLSVLNSTWTHWLDAPPNLQKLISVSDFRSRMLTGYYASKCRSYDSNGLQYNIVNKCPFLLPLGLRKQIFYNCLDKRMRLCKSRDNERLLVQLSRKKNLEDTRRIFSGARCLYSRFGFTFQDEKGFGEGLAREAFREISQHFQAGELNLWFGEVSSSDNKEDGTCTSFVHSLKGLFPRANLIEGDENACEDFKLFGIVAAKALIDRELLDIPLNGAFYRSILGSIYVKFRKSYLDVADILPSTSKLIQQLQEVKRQKEVIESDSNLSQDEKSLKVQELTLGDGCSFENLMIYFTLPGHPHIELIAGGSDVMLSPLNVEEYLDRLGEVVVSEGAKHRIDSFNAGFKKLLGISVGIFSPEELEVLLVGEFKEIWSVEYLKTCLINEYSRGAEYKTVEYLFQVLASFSSEEQHLFLEFVTGRSRLPPGGLAALLPPMTVRINGSIKDVSLPVSSTCFNVLYLPQYSSPEILRLKLLQAIYEGRNSFQLI